MLGDSSDYFGSGSAQPYPPHPGSFVNFIIAVGVAVTCTGAQNPESQSAHIIVIYRSPEEFVRCRWALSIATGARFRVHYGFRFVDINASFSRTARLPQTLPTSPG